MNRAFRLPRDLSWLHMIVRIHLGSERARLGSPRFSKQPGIRQLRIIERWLQDNHLPQTLFDCFGAPKNDYVHVFFRSDQPSKTMAFRVLCNELGLSDSLDQGRIVINRCARTTPPLLDLANGGL